MSDRVPSDHSSVETVRATLARAGRTDRPKVVLPDDADLPEGVVRLVLDGRVCHAPVERGLDGTLELPGAYDTAPAARERAGENRLTEWVRDADLDFGRSVLLDVLVAGTRYGLRAPGERAVYDVPGRPDEGLASIAEQVERRGGAVGDDRDGQET